MGVDIDRITGKERSTRWKWIDFIERSEPSALIGRCFYNTDKEVLSFFDTNSVRIDIGEDLITRVKNVQGSTINKGQVVYLFSSSGSNPSVKLAKAALLSTARAFGVVLKDSISNNGVGKVVKSGRISEIDTSSFSEGDTLYVSPSTAGVLTNTKPSYPNFAFKVGVVVKSSANQGIIEVDIDRELNVFTSGSVLFANGNGELSEDNINLFWSVANDRFGVGTNSPSEKLHVAGNIKVDDEVIADNRPLTRYVMLLS